MNDKNLSVKFMGLEELNKAVCVKGQQFSKYNPKIFEMHTLQYITIQ